MPGESVHLVGNGACGGVRVLVEAILKVPKFPFVIASSGTFTSEQGLLVAGVRSPEDLSEGIVEERLGPGHMASNCNVEKAVHLGPSTHVTGDVQAVGTARVEQGARVDGAVKNGAATVDIPRVPILDPTEGKTGDDLQVVETAKLNQPVLEGWVRRDGNLSVTGDLKLNGAVVRVNGDLTVAGGIVGRGAVFVTGKTTVQGGSRLSTDQISAIVSRGDVSLVGSDRDSSHFQGLIYTEGDFAARSISLLGTFIANGRQARLVGGSGTAPPQEIVGSRMEMEDVTLIQVPDWQKIEVDIPIGTAPPASVLETVQSSAGGLPITAGQGTAPDWRGSPPYPPVSCQGSAYCQATASLSPADYYDASDGKFHAERVKAEDVSFKFVSYHLFPATMYPLSNGGWAPYGQSQQTYAPRFPDSKRADVVAFLSSKGLDGESVVSSAERQALDAAKAELTKRNEKYATYVETQQARIRAGEKQAFSLDLNRFLSTGGNVRLLLWKDL